jgi:hypothetical protein
MVMTDGINYRREIADFLAANKAIMGDIKVVTTQLGETIDLTNMTDEQAKTAAETLFIVGTPTKLGALGRK